MASLSEIFVKVSYQNDTGSLNNVVKSAKNLGTSLNSNVSKAIKNVSNSFKGLGTSLNGIKGNISKAFNSSAINKFKSTSMQAFSSIKGGINSIRNSKPFALISKGVDSLKAKVGGLKGAFGGIKGAIAGLIAVAGVFTFLKGSVDEYKGSLEAQTKLQTSLSANRNINANPTILKQATSELLNQQNAIQKIGVYDDDIVASAQGALASYGLTSKEITGITPKVIDLVAKQKGFNGTAEDAVGISNAIAKSIGTGQTKALAQAGVFLNENDKKMFQSMSTTQRAAFITEQLKKNVGNYNAEIAKTDLGRLQQGQILWANMKETVGQGVVKAIGALAPALFPLMDIVEKISTQGLDLLVVGIEKAKPILDNMFKSFSNAGGMKNLQDLGNTIKSLFTEIGTSLGALFSGIDFGVVGASLVKTVDVLIKTITQGLQFIKPVLDPILYGFGQFITFISPIIPPLMKIIAVIGGIALAFVVLSNPITWIIGAIGLVGLLISKWGVIWQGISTFFMSSMQAIGTFFVGIWQGISSFFMAIWNGFVAIVSTVFSIIVGVINVRINVIKAYIKGIVSVVTFVFNLAKSIITGNFTQAGAMVSGAINGIISKIQSIINKVKEIGSAVLNAFNPKNWKLPNIKLPFVGKNYTGTENWRGGLTTVAEKGAELIQTPGGSPFIANNETMLNLPKGTIIKNARDTQAMLSKTNITSPPTMENSLISPVTTSNTSNTSNVSTNNTTSQNTSKSIVIQNMTVVANNVNQFKDELMFASLKAGF